MRAGSESVAVVFRARQAVVGARGRRQIGALVDAFEAIPRTLRIRRAWIPRVHAACGTGACVGAVAELAVHARLAVAIGGEHAHASAVAGGVGALVAVITRIAVRLE